MVCSWSGVNTVISAMVKYNTLTSYEVRLLDSFLFISLFK
jgi:hypothetical protein